MGLGLMTGHILLNAKDALIQPCEKDKSFSGEEQEGDNTNKYCIDEYSVPQKVNDHTILGLEKNDTNENRCGCGTDTNGTKDIEHNIQDLCTSNEPSLLNSKK